MKKRNLKVLSMLLVASMAVPQAAGTLGYTSLKVQAEDSVSKDTKTLQDGINDAWTQDETTVKGDDTIRAVEDGWLHLKASTGNGNGTTDNTGNPLPAMFVNPNTFDFSKDGYFEATLKSGTTPANTRFGIYLGYKDAGNGMFVGYDTGGWFWQKYQGGDGDWYQGSRVAAPAQNTETTFRIDWTADKKLTLTVDGEKAFEEDFSSLTDLTDKIAIKVGGWSGTPSDVYLKDIHYTGQAEETTYQVTGKVVDESGVPVEGAEVKAGDQTTTTAADGTYMMALADGTYDITVKKGGYVIGNGQVVVNGADAAVAEIVLKAEDEIATKVLSSEQMDVYVAENFPSVVRYEMKGDLAGKTFYGQTEEINTVKINGTEVALDAEDVETKFEDDKAVYTMTVKDEENHIDAVITAELVVEKNTLAFNITDIKNNLQDEVEINKYGNKVEKYPLQTIAIPNHSLISVRSNQENANLKGATMSSNTHISGDEFIEVNSEMGDYKDRDYMYAFISNNEMSAGMWSNSEHEGRAASVGVNGGSHNTRIYATSKDNGDYKTMGLASAEWYYHRNVTDSKGVKYTVTETEMPQSKIIIAGDMNEDAQIDWQDGAVAFRDIMNNPYKSEEVPELVAYRIAMNFGGQAQNPFLTTLDNVKRVAMHTDGLGQSVLLKGYASEGHDSGHPDYDNIGERLGGAKDMNTMMEKGKEYGARFGIHVNASEMYPEAKAFSEELVRRDGSGNLRYGWNWLDQGIGIDGIYDLASGEREKRFDALKPKVKDNMDFVYVDVWGNCTSGVEDSWETRKLTDMITDNGWRMTTEWGSGNEYDSTFQHWATDLTYGGYTLKGENSEVMRFLRNHQKDSWVGDYPSYGGVANAPLLGGYNMKDFEGWQGRNDYDAYIRNLYTHDLMTKFLQHYKVTKWVDGEPVQMSDNNQTYSWTPEKEITLKDDDGNTVVATRESTDPSTPEYRNRTVTLNGKVISQGAVSRGDNGQGGTESYLIPWNWDPQTGDAVASEKEKMYHWNTKGGTTTWELQDDWKYLENVKVYKLTDLGKTEEKTVDVVDGKITLEAEAQTPYVVCKGDEGNLDITWSEGMHLVDVGFNSGEEGLDTHWTKSGEGTATIAKSQYSNPMLKLDGEVAVSQKITDLEPGKEYALYLGVDNRSDAKAKIEVKAGDKVLDSNYTTRSIAKNYIKAYTHSNSSATVDNSSYFQNMYVFFTAPEDGSEVTLTISKDAGDGSAYFDDVRVVESNMDVVKKDKDGNVVGISQDFENNVQGIYPFVIGGIEGVEDNRTHLSELHAPYTQANWDVKKMDDVLEGKWSIKTNGLTQRNALVYQTIPQNFRFEPGRTYKVSFDYQAGTDGTYAVTIGNGEFSGGTALEPLAMAMGADADGHYETTITGDASGQTWFGIYSTSTPADTQGTSGSAANFGGYQDFVLDNLKIELVEEDVNKDTLNALIEEAESKYEENDYTLEEWNAFEEALLNAKVAVNKDKTSQKDLEDAYYALKAAMSALDNSAGTAAEDRFDIATELYGVSAGSYQPASGGEGPAEFAIDGDASTHWHTKWGYNAVAAGEAWFNVHFDEAQTVDGIRYLPRQSGDNGKLKTADIMISKDNGATWETVVDDASFDTATRWQKVSFAETEGVTDVRILATATAGDGSQFASAAEFRVTKPVAPVIDEVDKTELKTAIDKAAALVKDDYTEASWKVFEEKLAEAQAVFANGDATQYDVALALANLEDAMADLVADSEISTSILSYAIELAEKADTSNVIDSVLARYEKALANAKDILARVEAGDDSVTQSMVDESWQELMKVLQFMEFKKGDKTELQALVDMAKELDLDDYIEAGKKEFEDALAEAEKVLADGDAMQPEIDEAYDNLLNAMNNLVKKADKTNLISVINMAETIVPNLDKYQEEGKQEFLDALDAAKVIRDKDDATEAEVTEAWNTLLTAMSKLRLIPDKGALEDLINSVNAMDLSVYSASAQARVRSALAAATSVYENEKATQAEVDAAVANLQAAVDTANAETGKEEEKGTAGTTDKSGNSNDKSSTGSSAAGTKVSGQKSAKTGDTSNAAMLAGAMAAALAAMAAFKKRREDD